MAPRGTPTPGRAAPRSATNARHLAHAKASLWLADGLKRLADVDDTHPRCATACVRRAKPGVPRAAEVSAAEALLGSSPKRLDPPPRRALARDVARLWSERHRYANGQRHLIEELEKESATGAVDADDHLLWRAPCACSMATRPARRCCAGWSASGPTTCPAATSSACCWIDEADAARSEEGAECCARRRGRQQPLAFSAAARETWLERGERFDELKKWRELLRKRDAEATEAMEACTSSTTPQHFEPARMSRRVLRSLQDLLRGERAAGRAFVVRKGCGGARLALLPRHRRARQGHRPADAQSWWAELRERIELPFPFMVIDLAHPYWADKARQPLVEQMLRCRTRRSTPRAAEPGTCPRSSAAALGRDPDDVLRRILMSQVLQCTQFCALICRRSDPSSFLTNS